MKIKNPSAVLLGKQSAKSRKNKLGKKAFNTSMRDLRLNALKNKAKVIHIIS